MPLPGKHRKSSAPWFHPQVFDSSSREFLKEEEARYEGKRKGETGRRERTSEEADVVRALRALSTLTLRLLQDFATTGTL